jgi:hypothetical protein
MNFRSKKSKKSKKSKRNRNLTRKSMKRNRNRNRKSMKNKRLKKYGGRQTHIFITFFGDRLYQPDMKFDVDTTIGELAFSKNGDLYHRGRLLSTYPLNKRVYDVLPKDKEHPVTYNIHQISKSEEPPETIEIVPVTPYVYDEDPND